jgi:hypothetical protein
MEQERAHTGESLLVLSPDDDTPRILTEQG